MEEADLVADLPSGPKEPHSTVLSREDEAIIVAFRRHTLLPLDGCLYALQATIPHLTRSSLHRCLQRHGISRLLPHRYCGGAFAAERALVCFVNWLQEYVRLQLLSDHRHTVCLKHLCYQLLQVRIARAPRQRVALSGSNRDRLIPPIQFHHEM